VEGKMKLICWIILLSTTINSFAATDSLIGLEEAISEYEFALTVEWDQKDEAVFERESALLTTRLEALQKAGKLTPSDVAALLTAKIKNPQILSKLQQELQLQSVSSLEAVKQIVMKNPMLLRSQGASWDGMNGNLFVGLLGGILLVGIIGSALAAADTTCRHTGYDDRYDYYDCELSE
jgi:small-conductance mechanosensitive channel